MSDAIDNAEVMLSCLSLPYKESASAYRPGSPVMQLASYPSSLLRSVHRSLVVVSA
jgi:hypothetical protein